MSEAVTLADLRRIDLFDELDDAELQQWVDVAEIRWFEPGEVLEDVGVQVSGLLLLLDGTARSFLVEQNRLEPVGRQLPPTWMGAIAALTEGPLGVRMVAETRCRIAHVDAAQFRRLALSQPAVHRRVMRQVGPVMSRLTGLEHNRERLAALGTMAAGLAHELNNPAAAARRAAAGVVEALEVVNSALASFVESGVERDGAARLLELQREALARAAEATALDALDAADAEDDLRDRLEDMGVGEAWRLAEPLAAAGVDQEWLDRVARSAGPATDAALRWVAASLSAGRLAAELEEATGRMSALVSAVKSYAYMDRGALVEVDLHEGLETTLTVLGHKLKHTAIAVRRDYDRHLPRLTVRGSELNQVWTNLLDNAIDALGEQGTIRITTRADGGCAVVEIADDGPGVPAEIQDRVFDPFFTTKEVGHGTGLGLSTARQIVVDRHDGSMSLDSKPGRTSFTVRIPLTQR